MNGEELKKRYLAFAHEIWESGRSSAIDEMLAPDSLRVDPEAGTGGPSQLRAQHTEITQALSERRFEVHDVVVDGDRLMSRVTLSGRHVGRLFGYAPTGRHVAFDLMTFSRWRDGRMIESRVIWDREALRETFSGGVIEAAGTQLYFESFGAGRPMMLVHGGSGLDHNYFRPWLDPLGARAELFFFDQRGCGRSRREPMDAVDTARLADDVEAMRERLGLERPVLLGHSHGGFVALEYALRHPGRLGGLILADTAPALDYPNAIVAGVQARGTAEQAALFLGALGGGARDDAHFREVWPKVLPLYFHRPDARTIESMHVRTTYAAAALNRSLRAATEWSAGSRLREIDVPTLVIAGADDFMTPPHEAAQRLHDGIGGSEMVVIERAGHFPFIEQPGTFLRAVESFLDRVP